MTKTKWIIFVFSICLVLFLFINTANASSVGLIENVTWQYNLTGVFHSSTAFGDIDNDGDLDLALSGKDSNGNKIAKIYENNGTSLVENVTWQQNLTRAYWSSTAFGDIDNDGDLDLALTGCLTSSSSLRCLGNTIAKIYINNGTSLVENVTWQQNLTTAGEGAIAFGDIDNDGDLDLITTGYNSNSGYIAKFYINNGTSLVESTQWQHNLTSIYESATAFGDIDNDGDLDLALSGLRQNPPYKITKIYINNGTSLVESTQWQQNLIGLYQSSLIWNDYDNDNDLDLIIMGCCDRLRVYNNNGTSLVLNQTETISGGDHLIGIFDGSIGVGDYDNDGDLDLAAIGRETRRSRIYENSNTTFIENAVAHSNISNNLIQGALAWGDVDNDTDLDIVITAQDNTNYIAKIYINNITTPNTQPEPPNAFINYTTEDGKIHLGWTNGSDTETPNNALYYNLKVGSTSGGHEIVSGIYGGGEDNGYFGNMLQRKNITLKTTRLSANTNYFWSIQVIDTGLQKSAWSSEQNFTTKGDLVHPTITLNQPINNFNTTNPTITFNTTVYDNIKVQNVSLYGNWSNWHLNTTNSSGLNNTEYIFTNNLTTYGDGIYIWTIKSCDNSTLCKYSSNRTFTIDTTYPYIYLRNPINESTWTESSTITFNYNVTDLTISNCSLIINNDIKQTDTSITEKTNQIFTYTLNNGNYNWSINCTDTLAYTNSSNPYKLTVSYKPSSGGPSGGGGTSISTPTTKITKSPKPITLTKDKPTQISIGTSTHKITILKLTKTSVTIKINPTLTLNIGETKIITLNNQKISITLEKIKNSKAYLLFNLIEETKKQIQQSKEIQEPKKQPIKEKIEEITKKPFSYMSFLLILALIIIIYFYYKRKSKKPWWLKGS